MKNEKLVEATILALRGKLLEEVDRDFKKVLDYINGDYHRVEDFTDLEVCYPNEEDTDWLDAYDVANELLNKLSKEDWATMAKEIDDGTLRDKLTDWGMKASSLEEAREILDKERERIANKHTENKKVTEAIDEKSLEISIDLKNKTYQEWFDEMKNKYGLVYQYTSVLGPKDAPVGKIYVFKDNEDYNYAITNGREFNKLYDSGKLIIKGKKDIAKKTETKNDLMSFEDWVDYIDIKKEYPEWFKDKQELDRPFLDVINDHMDELNRDYRKYKRSQSKKKTESNKLPNTKNLVDLEHKLSDLITNTDDTEVLDILQTMERLLSKYLLDKHISF